MRGWACCGPRPRDKNEHASAVVKEIFATASRTSWWSGMSTGRGIPFGTFG